MSTTNYISQNGFIKGTFEPVFDPVGNSVANRVLNEIHVIQAEQVIDWQVIVPLFSPFYSDGFSVSFKPVGESNFVTLVEGIDFFFVYQFIGASRSIGKAIYGGISLTNNITDGQVRINQYQALGGNWSIGISLINQILADKIHNPKITTWEQIAAVPTVFPVIDHEYNLQDQVGASDIVQAIEGISQAIAQQPISPDNGAMAALLDHLNDTNNPHSQYITQAMFEDLFANNNFRGAFGGLVSLNSANYDLPNGSSFKDSVGVFSLQFNNDNVANCTLTLVGGSAKPIVDVNGNNIPEKEILAGETRVLVSTGTKYVLVNINKHSSLPFLPSAFTNVAQNDLVRFDNGSLSKAIADGIGFNGNVIGFADKANNKVVYNGILSGFSGLVIDETYYLSPTTAGGITSSKPNNDVVVAGIAKSATELFVNITKGVAGDMMPTGGGADKVFYLNSNIVTESYTIPDNTTAGTFGDVEIADGVEVTIGDNSDWVIV